jgi:hypothetical protein
LESGAITVLQRTPCRVSEQGRCRIRQAREPLPARSGQTTLGAAARVWTQLGGPLEEGRRGRDPAACPSLFGRRFELGRNVLVGRERGLGPVPGTAVGIEFWVGDLGEHTMRRAPLLGRCGAVQRRTKQRVTERDASNPR